MSSRMFSMLKMHRDGGLQAFVPSLSAMYASALEVEREDELKLRDDLEGPPVPSVAEPYSHSLRVFSGPRLSTPEENGHFLSLPHSLAHSVSPSHLAPSPASSSSTASHHFFPRILSSAPETTTTGYHYHYPPPMYSGMAAASAPCALWSATPLGQSSFSHTLHAVPGESSAYRQQAASYQYLASTAPLGGHTGVHALSSPLSSPRRGGSSSSSSSSSHHPPPFLPHDSHHLLLSHPAREGLDGAGTASFSPDLPYTLLPPLVAPALSPSSPATSDRVYRPPLTGQKAQLESHGGDGPLVASGSSPVRSSPPTPPTSRRL